MKTALIALATIGALMTIGRIHKLNSSYSSQQCGSDVSCAWEAWKVEHGKNYLSQEEHDNRFSIFAANHEKINKINSNPQFTWTAGHNKFSDLTVKEFKATYTGYKPVERLTNVRSQKHLAVSSERDWVADGAVTPIKDQGACGSCWAFSATGAMEGLNYKLTGSLPNYSEEFFLLCDKGFPDMGCNGGNSAITMMWTESNGIITQDRMPYNANDKGTCYWSKYTSDFFNNDLIDVPADDNDEMIAAIDQQPVSIAVDAGLMQHYSHGILNDWSCGTDLDHAILAVGYGEENGNLYYKVKNSWGTSWGEAGYIRFARRTGKSVGMCGLTSAACYPTGQNPKP